MQLSACDRVRKAYLVAIRAVGSECFISPEGKQLRCVLLHDERTINVSMVGARGGPSIRACQLDVALDLHAQDGSIRHAQSWWHIMP